MFVDSHAKEKSRVDRPVAFSTSKQLQAVKWKASYELEFALPRSLFDVETLPDNAKRIRKTTTSTITTTTP